MARYIDVNRLCEWLKNLKSGFTKEELVFRDELIEHLKGNNGITNVLPTADVQEVVRCKDCKHLYCLSAIDRRFYCRHHPQGLTGINIIEDNPFCSYGKRKEGD